MTLSVRAIVLVTLLAACGGDGSSGPELFPVRRVVIRRPDGAAADTVERARAFGPMAFRLQAFDAAGFQLTSDRYAERWTSSDVNVASVASTGLATARGNGRTLLIASADGVADTVALVVEQEAIAARSEQDTIVALAPGAQRLGGGADITGPAQFTIVSVDANGAEAPSPGPIVVTNLDPALVDVAHFAGDTVRVTGLAAGTARVAIGFADFRDTVVVHVVSAYAVITTGTSQAGLFFQPSQVTIPAGAAAIFRNAEAELAGAAGQGWSVGPIAGRSYEGQLFTTPGTYPFSSGTASGSVVVTP